mgnify:CR=1 FL=1
MPRRQEGRESQMKSFVKIAFASSAAIVGCLLIAGFVMVPSIFAAKYEAEKMTMSDGAELVTIVRLPDGEGPFPTLIVRSPYDLPHTPLSGLPSEDFSNVDDKDLPKVIWQAVIDAGYALVVQHTRGRIGSDGQALLNKDRDDALELIAWVQQQDWSNGKIGTTGDSIEAIMAMLTNAENPEGVQASFVQIGTPSLINDAMFGPGGAIKLETFLPWTAEQILTADDTHYEAIGYGPIKRRTSLISMMLKGQALLSDLETPHTVSAWRHLPLKDYPHFAAASEGWNAILDARPGDELAEYFNGSVTDIPTYYVAAWMDVFASSQLSSFARGEVRNADQRLLILNGTHFAPESPTTWPIQPMLPWFDYHLKGEASALLDLPRVIFPIANADDEWYGTDTWPPAAIQTETWVLSYDAGIRPPTAVKVTDENDAEPDADDLSNPEFVLARASVASGTRGYAYDPDHPVPTVGGKNLLITHGPKDQRGVRENDRSDVLSYESDVLTTDLIVAGPLTANVSVSSDARDTDFTLKVLDITPTGEAILVTEGIQRARFRESLNTEVFMVPGQVYTLDIDLGHMAWRFKSGHRLAIDISSSNFPQWDRNLNTDAPLFSSTDRQIANNVIHHGAPYGTSIQLPVVPDLGAFERMHGYTTEPYVPLED